MNEYKAKCTKWQKAYSTGKVRAITLFGSRLHGGGIVTWVTVLLKHSNETALFIIEAWYLRESIYIYVRIFYITKALRVVAHVEVHLCNFLIFMYFHVSSLFLFGSMPIVPAISVLIFILCSWFFKLPCILSKWRLIRWRVGGTEHYSDFPVHVCYASFFLLTCRIALLGK